jgi:hypothetical protein
MGSGDAALLVLQQRTDAPSMALATSADSALWKAGVHGIMAGFGDRYPRQTQRPKRLQWAPTVLQSAEWCGRHGIYFHPSTQLCSIDPPRYATGGCNGDSGGPLIVKSGKRAEVEVGILRAVVEPFGIKTECPTSEPTVYTRTEAVARWVGEWTARLGGRRARSKPRAADLRGSPSFVAGRDLSSAQRISR